MKKILLLIGILFVAGCSSRVTPINQQQDVASQTNTYKLSVPNEKGSDGHKYWFVTIEDLEGTQLYKDTDLEFVGNLNVYWVWDGSDRVWLYSTDTGRVYVWIYEDEQWNKHFWGHAKDKRVYRESIKPPLELFPDYNKDK